jgi:hypothetical protein
MTTKNGSIIKVDRVHLSRKDYDVLVDRDKEFLTKLSTLYPGTWHLGGVTFKNITEDDIIKLVQTL